MKPYWYVSFAKNGFRGGLFLRANSMAEFLAEANHRGLNPGGEAAGAQVPDSHQSDVAPEAEGRILTMDELDDLFPTWEFKVLADAEAEGKQFDYDRIQVVHDECNRNPS